LAEDLFNFLNYEKTMANEDSKAKWKAHAYPLQRIRIDLQGTQHSTRESILRQLTAVVERVERGDDRGEDHDDDFGYKFTVTTEETSVFGDDPAAVREVTTARRTHGERQQQTIQAPGSKTFPPENAAYACLLERKDVKDALFRLESVQAKRDSVSRKLCAGSAAVSVEDLARLETDLASAKESLVRLAEHSPLIMKHPLLATIGNRSRNLGGRDA
jgi:hypothetical protein